MKNIPATWDAQKDTPETPRYDAWGNEILDAPGPLGQYHIRGARDGRVISVSSKSERNA